MIGAERRALQILKLCQLNPKKIGSYIVQNITELQDLHNQELEKLRAEYSERVDDLRVDNVVLRRQNEKLKQELENARALLENTRMAG